MIVILLSVFDDILIYPLHFSESQSLLVKTAINCALTLGRMYMHCYIFYTHCPRWIQSDP